MQESVIMARGTLMPKDNTSWEELQILHTNLLLLSPTALCLERMCPQDDVMISSYFAIESLCVTDINLNIESSILSPASVCIC